MTDKTTFFCPLTRDEVLQSNAKQMSYFAAINKISEDKAVELLVSAERTKEFQECKEEDPVKLNKITIKIAQQLLDNRSKDSHIIDAKTPPTSPIL